VIEEDPAPPAQVIEEDPAPPAKVIEEPPSVPPVWATTGERTDQSPGSDAPQTAEHGDPAYTTYYRNTDAGVLRAPYDDDH
jgi:hypothetical protein